MFNFPKEQEKKPFSFASIEMRKSSSKLGWVAIIVLGVVVLVFFIFVSK